MKLTELHPAFLSSGGEGITRADTGEPVPLSEGVGVNFDCPCGCDSPCFVPFTNPIGGGAPCDPNHGWQRTGETFETLTLTPSILRNPIRGGCGWHGYITDGEIRTC